MKLKTAFCFALMIAAAAPLAACAGADASDEGTTEESEDALTSTARAFVGEYRWNAATEYLDFERLELKDSRSAWGKYEAQVDVSITGVRIFCFRAPCTSLETGTWKISKSRGALTLKVRPTGRRERAYGIVRQSDGTLLISRNGESGVLTSAEDPCNLTDCPTGTHCVSSGGSATCEVNPGGCATVRCASGTQCVEGANGAATCEPVRGPGCAATLCMTGTTCVEDANGVAECKPNTTAPCVKTGCSGHICADQQRITTCEFRPEYACYQQAVCERNASGQCGFRQTSALTSCLASP